MDSLILALGVAGWGLFLIGAISHLSHFERLIDLLVLHFRSPRPAAIALVAAEVAIAALIPMGLLLGLQPIVRLTALAGAVVGAAFAAWVLRLFLSDSTLPCACSFSSAPTTLWSVIRATGTVAIGLLAFVADQPTTLVLTALAVGAAAGTAGFVLPDALSWPEESQRLRTLAANPESSR